MDKNTFCENVLECEDTMYHISIAMLKNEFDAQDAVQEAILSAYKNLHKLKKPCYFKTWLIRILINQCKKQLKSRQHFTSLSGDIASTNDAFLKTEIFDSIARLPEKLRIVTVLYYIDGMSIKKIKSVLKIPEGTVKSRLYKARGILKLDLAD